MYAIFPVIEGDNNSSLSKDFIGSALSRHYDELNSLAEAGEYGSINDFEYFDPTMLAEFEIELDEEQAEWHGKAEGVTAFESLLKDGNLPKDEELRSDISELLNILQSIPDSSKGWRLEQDI